MDFLYPQSKEYRRITTFYSSEHRAVDYYMPIGTPLRAPMAGLAVRDSTVGGGNVLWIFGQDYAVRMVHLSEFKVQNYTEVFTGQQVTLSGNTGTLTTGPHLHLEIWQNVPASTPQTDVVNTQVDWVGMMLNNSTRKFIRIPPVPLLSDDVIAGAGMKVFYHIINNQPWMGSVLTSFNKYTLAVKKLNPSYPDQFPNHRVIGRLTPKGADNDGWEHGLIDRGAEGAEEYFKTLYPSYKAGVGAVSIWEGPNEPALDTDQQCTNLVNFYKRYVQLMHGEGWLVAGFNKSAGTPQLRAADPSSRKWEILAPIYKMVDMRTAHYYWLPRGVNAPSTGPSDNWTSLRYRLDESEINGLGYKTADMAGMFINEAGWDGGVYGYMVGHGWKDLGKSKEQYQSELSEWYGNLDADPYIRGACIFTVGPTPDWNSFEEDEAMARWQAAQCRGGIVWAKPVINPVPVPPPPKPELPEDIIDTTHDLHILCDKNRWWTQEAIRQAEAGHGARALDILKSKVKLETEILGLV